MPAATSHEDIYRLSSSSFCSSSYNSASSASSSAASSPSFSYLPDYMMLADGQSAGEQQQQQQRKHRQQPTGRHHNQKLHQRQLYQRQRGQDQAQVGQQQQQQQAAARHSGSSQQLHLSPCRQWRAYPFDEEHLDESAMLDLLSCGGGGVGGAQMQLERQSRNQTIISQQAQSSNSYTTGLATSAGPQSESGELIPLADCFSPLSMTPPSQQQHYLTIEELRLARNSCWLCGCNWQQDHVSLDCSECGGYALTRPCPSCDGLCKQTWKRSINETHDNHKAIWVGQCSNKLSAAASCSTDCPEQVNKLGVPTLASSCCSSHPSSAASSDCESEPASLQSKPTGSSGGSNGQATALFVCN